METNFLVIFTFLFLQRFGRSSNTMIMASSNVTCIERERNSLLVFKQSLKDEYDLLSTWRGVECCEWRGVGCDTRNGHVVKLDLRAPAEPLRSFIFYREKKMLTGELNPSLQNLKHLRYLDLSNNDFSGDIPEFLGSFVRLEYLNLSGSGLGGVVPYHLGNLSRLQYLDIRTYFTTNDYSISSFGTRIIIDDLGWVSSLLSLRYLDLSGIRIGNLTDWFHSVVNMLPSLQTLNMAACHINIPPVKFVNFTSLNSLDLSSNGINSTIPIWFSNLTSLMHLNLHNNQFHGKIPGIIGMFSSLASIDLGSNSFDTLMPKFVCNLSSLVHLDTSFNMFSGPIPARLGLLLRLEELDLSDNQLTGNIPTSLSQLSKLKKLDLSFNSLVGVLSELHFANLKNLNSLSLSWNTLALNFSSRWIPPFQLQRFFASSCDVGPRFPNWLQTQINIQRLCLSNSSIRDTLPEWFENILSHNLFHMDLSNNQIYGKLPQFHFISDNITREGVLKMNSNKFEGSLATLPSNVRRLDLSDNLLSGPIPQTDGTMEISLEIVNLSKNRFTGSIPVDLCKAPMIIILDLSQNNFSGRLPGCLGTLLELDVIDLANNAITGDVPSSWGSITYLKSLHLKNNKFEGDIPVSLQNLTELVTMDLGNNLFTGTIPFWIGEKLSNLRMLNLKSNKFTGNIPLELCQLGALQYLSLARNNITGTIPRCFGNLTGMMIMTSRDDYNYYSYEENILASTKGGQLLYTKTIKFLTSLDLSSNNIIGEIPDALVYLVGLKSLNLSRNLLKGPIPINIGNLSQLESLDLSMNKLYGRIPQSLTSLYSLSYLNMSFNNLSGPIPVGNQLQTLDDSSIYEGNNGLCGPPLLRSCKGNDASYNNVGEDEGQDGTKDLWFYAGMGPGFVVGFVGLLGSLHFIKKWRVAYFEMLENVYGWITLSTRSTESCSPKEEYLRMRYVRSLIHKTAG